MSEVKRYVALSKDEDNLMRRLLIDAVQVGAMTVTEIEALNNLRRKFNLPEIQPAGIRWPG